MLKTSRNSTLLCKLIPEVARYDNHGHQYGPRGEPLDRSHDVSMGEESAEETRSKHLPPAGEETVVDVAFGIVSEEPSAEDSVREMFAKFWRVNTCENTR